MNHQFLLTLLVLPTFDMLFHPADPPEHLKQAFPNQAIIGVQYSTIQVYAPVWFTLCNKCGLLRG